IYSIINSLIWGLYSLQVTSHRPRQQSHPLGERETEQLFLSLITRLTRKHGTRSIIDGISALELAHLLRHSAAWLRAKRGLQPVVARPFYRQPRATMRQVCQALSAPLAAA